ncbi:hypothetical protein HPP92_007099 [Vanilla planifolia]|uniref:Uncharacterized protein n=1 Tax=Vanilla planifolia TaxID=51239 RepID=A0A835V8D3_VANPL|nr:hypothetical protein HPP92_007099 [Vanilla planifolia]
MEPFPSLAFKVLILNGCYYHQDAHTLLRGLRPHVFGGQIAPSLRRGLALHRRPGVGRTLKRHPFSGLVDSVGELLHTP